MPTERQIAAGAEVGMVVGMGRSVVERVLVAAEAVAHQCPTCGGEGVVGRGSSGPGHQPGFGGPWSACEACGGSGFDPATTEWVCIHKGDQTAEYPICRPYKGRNVNGGMAHRECGIYRKRGARLGPN